MYGVQRMFKDYYKILQVHYSAEQEVIEASYKRLCRKYHPDLHPGRYAEERMKELNCAYEVLGDNGNRSAYHRQWMKIYGITNKISDSNITKQPAADNQSSDEAMRLLQGYFDDLMNFRYHSAYSRLSCFNKNNISQEEFVKWQEAVSRVYTLGSYSITFFKEYESPAFDEGLYKAAREYGIEITDKCIRTGRVNKDYIKKYVVLEESGWCVSLGYTDLQELINKFEHLEKSMVSVNHELVFNRMIMKIDSLTGLPNREGFLEKAEAESERCIRYGRTFSLVVFLIESNKYEHPEFHDKVSLLQIEKAAAIINSNLRTSDIIARWSDNKFIILLSETDSDAAGMAVKKLYPHFQSQFAADILLHIGIAQYFTGNLTEKIIQAEFHSFFSKFKSRSRNKKINYRITKQIDLITKYIFQKKR